VRYLLENKINAYSPGYIFFNEKEREKISWIPTFKVLPGWFFYKPNQEKISK